MTKDILGEKYADIMNEINHILICDDFKVAYIAYKKLLEFINNNKSNEDLEEYKNIKYATKQLKWVALPFFSQEEVLNFFSEDLAEMFTIEDFDIWAKLKHCLVGIVIYEDRDKFKTKILNILNKSKTILTKEKIENNVSPTVENWIKYYTSVLGNKQVDLIKFRQLFIDGKEIKKLSFDEKEKIEIFFSFYECLKLSSLTVAGFEGSIPVNANNFKGFIRNGKLEKETKMDYKTQAILDIVQGKSIMDIKKSLSIPKTEEEKKIDELRREEEQFSEGGLERLAIEEEIDKKKKLESLKIEANKYTAGSLERMAVEEEIRRFD